MSDKKDKKFSGRKLLYMLFSLLASVCLWMYVSIAEKPDVSMPVSGIQVELSGTDVLADRKLVVTELSHETISIRFIGARAKVVELSNENVYVSLDVSKIDSPGKYTLKPTPVYDNKIDSGSISVSSSSTDYITVTVDNLVEKTVTVRGSFDGEVENDYLAMPVEVSPETITISGPEKIVSEVSYAQATIEYDNLTSSIDEDVQVVLMNSNNEPVDDKLLTLSQDTVNVKMQVDMVKEIPLSVNFVYGAGTSEDSGNVVYDIEPATIKISGDATVLNELTSIVLGTIDLTKFASTTVETMSIVIPNDCTNITGTVEATVTVEVTGLDTKKLSATNIEMSNQPKGYTADLVTQSLDITLRGPEESVKNVTSDNIRIVADLSEISNTVGTYTVRAKVYVDGYSDVGAVGDNFVTVTVTKG